MDTAALLARLRAFHGPQHWWPASQRFEMMAGAVLTQNTAWGNVEKALAALAAADLLSPEALAGAPPARIEALIRPAGYYRVKTGRLRNLAQAIIDAGGLAALERLPTPALRRRLLAVKGVGPETADAIAVYAFERPLFIADAYARRLYGRLGLSEPGASYERLQGEVSAGLRLDAASANELHALIVAHGKRFCRARPRCAQCPLAPDCPTAAG